MKCHSEPDELTSSSVDYSVAMARSVAGLVPLFGPLLAEIIGVTIPEQRIDRVAKFSRDLDRRLGAVESSILEQTLNDEDFTDLIEEGVRQAARSLSDERREYIAALIVNGLSSDDIDVAESKHLLRVLDEVNDIEIVWLRFYRHPTVGGDVDFRTTHDDVLRPIVATMGSSRETLTKATLQKSYKEHLCQVGLLQPRYRVDRDTGLPEFDSHSGTPKESGYRLTSLGRLLLDSIGLGDDDGNP